MKRRLDPDYIVTAICLLLALLLGYLVLPHHVMPMLIGVVVWLGVSMAIVAVIFPYSPHDDEESEQ